jgi:hypothetical protein
MVPPFDDRLRHVFSGPEGAIQNLAGFQVLQLHPDEGSALPRLDVLVLNDREDAVFQVEGHARTNVIG